MDHTITIAEPLCFELFKRSIFIKNKIFIDLSHIKTINNYTIVVQLSLKNILI